MSNHQSHPLLLALRLESIVLEMQKREEEALCLLHQPKGRPLPDGCRRKPAEKQKPCCLGDRSSRVLFLVLQTTEEVPSAD